MTTHVSDLMTTDLATVDPATPLQQAAQLMRDGNVGNVIVTEGNELVGLLTDRDIAVRAVADDRSAKETKVGDVASKDLHTLRPDDDLDAAAALMRDAAVRRAPVIDGGKLVGIVSLGDLARARERESALAQISSAPANH
jgi:CBS domain-containing protein